MTRENTAIWSVYDKLRTARLNVKYYCYRLEKTEFWNTVFQIILLASAPTSAIAGLWFWQSEYGKLAWQWLGCIAAIASIANAIYAPSKKIKQYEGVLTGYRTLEYDLMEIKSAIEQKGKYDTSLQNDFKRAVQREKTLVSKTPETRANVRILTLCEEQVRKELPDASFFIPETKDDRQENATTTATSTAATTSTTAATTTPIAPKP